MYPFVKQNGYHCLNSYTLELVTNRFSELNRQIAKVLPCSYRIIIEISFVSDYLEILFFEKNTDQECIVIGVVQR